RRGRLRGWLQASYATSWFERRLPTFARLRSVFGWSFKSLSGGAASGEPRSSWPGARHAETDPVHARLRGQVKRPAVVVAPGHVVWVLRAPESPQVLSIRRDDPKPARTGHIK